MPDLAWNLQDLHTGEDRWYDDLRAALDRAEALVGNKAWAHPDEDIYLLGHGDGTVRIMVRSFTRDEQATLLAHKRAT